MTGDRDPRRSPICPICGWQEQEGRHHLSSHVTSHGIVSYWRCVCGSVLVLAGDRVLGSTP